MRLYSLGSENISTITGTDIPSTVLSGALAQVLQKLQVSRSGKSSPIAAAVETTSDLKV